MHAVGSVPERAPLRAGTLWELMLQVRRELERVCVRQGVLVAEHLRHGMQVVPAVHCDGHVGAIDGDGGD